MSSAPYINQGTLASGSVVGIWGCLEAASDSVLLPVARSVIASNNLGVVSPSADCFYYEGAYYRLVSALLLFANGILSTSINRTFFNGVCGESNSLSYLTLSVLLPSREMRPFTNHPSDNS